VNAKKVKRLRRTFLLELALDHKAAVQAGRVAGVMQLDDFRQYKRLVGKGTIQAGYTLAVKMKKERG
jgi:hypothetical protein